MALSIAFIVTVLLIVSLWNVWRVTLVNNRPGPDALPAQQPTLSCLIPARNEANRIGNLLECLAQQTYPITEILVLDDNSTDGTAETVETYSRRDNRIRLLPGAQLPAGWFGKCFACEQLSQAAQGDLLLFIDADVVCEPFAVSRTVEELMREQYSLLSVFPSQVLHTRAERFVVPLMEVFLYSCLPLWTLEKVRDSRFAAANGQWMLFTRSAYIAVHGHSGVRAEVVEDVALARAVKVSGGTVAVLSGGDGIRCRMYAGWSEVVDGFSKNVFAASGYRAIPYLMFWSSVVFVFLTPPVLVGWTWWMLLPLGLIMLQRLALALRFRHPLLESTVGYPLGILAAVWIAFVSYRRQQSGTLKWKGRSL